jgi:transcriptional regulator
MRTREVLNKEQVSEIKYKLRLGYPQKSIALQYGVTIANISAIYRGKRWAHVE